MLLVYGFIKYSLAHCIDTTTGSEGKGFERDCSANSSLEIWGLASYLEAKLYNSNSSGI